MSVSFYTLIFSIFLCGFITNAAENTWKHESEVSIIQVEGNTSSESYGAKQATSYNFDLNVLSLTGRYLQTKSSGVETAKQWEAYARYERVLSENWTAFIQHGAESDYYSGYIQRDNTDLGGKYYFYKNEQSTLFSEAGLRYSKTLSTVDNSNSYQRSARLYLEYSKQINENMSGKFWIEYLPDLNTSDAYLVNYEPSVNVMMNKIFSLKVAYLVKYHNLTKTANEKKEDTTFTTALVAKF
ncbi:MAG: DUF481 domain-containing protein [Bdellovibrionales bacterium]|nr:DUF481 domain-containing protein [Bdellovibrionales bacterium]